MQTRGELMLALRKRRMAASPAFLRGGFRPFFFGGAAWAIIALTIWLVALATAAGLPSAFDALSWHRHEMLFGFVGAVIAGFLLTAVPNWTGRLPIAGWPLASLFGLWIAVRNRQPNQQKNIAKAKAKAEKEAKEKKNKEEAAPKGKRKVRQPPAQQVPGQAATGHTAASPAAGTPPWPLPPQPTGTSQRP